MNTVGLAIAAATVALALARWLRLPVGALAILAGVALGAAPLELDRELVNQGLLLAATFLVFSVGAELDRRELSRYRRAAWLVAGGYLVVTGVVASSLWWVLALDLPTAIYLVLALSSSSTFAVVGLLRRRKRFFEPVGRFVAGVIVAQDAAVVLALCLWVVATTEPNAAWQLGGLAALGLVAWSTGRWVAPRALIDWGLSEEERLLFVLGVLFAFVGACWWADLPFVLGAYLAGAALSRFPVGGTIRSHVAAFSDFFSVLFFTLLGVVLVVPTPRVLLGEAVLMGTVFLVRPLLLVPIARRLGMTVRSAIESVTLLAHSGEMALVVVLVGMALGQVGPDLLAVVAMVVVVTMALEPLLSSDRVVWWLVHHYPARRRAPSPSPHRDHVVLIGCGEGGRAVLDQLERAEFDVVVVEDDPTVVASLDDHGTPTVRGDGGDPATLRAAGVQAARAVVSTMRRLGDNMRLLSDGLPPRERVFVRVFSDDEADVLRRLGATPVVEAELASEAILRWCEERVEPAGVTRRDPKPSAPGRRRPGRRPPSG